MFGLGKPRSRFGKWLDSQGIKHTEISKKSGVSMDVITELTRPGDRRPSWNTEKKLIRAVREYDAEVSAEDFWG